MPKIIGPIPDNILRRMAPEDRKVYGKAGMTLEELEVKNSLQSEEELQEATASLLRLRNIRCFRSRMDKRPTGPTGWPDFIFAVRGRACAFECKRFGESPEPHQSEVMAALTNDGWFVRVVRSELQVVKALNEVFTNPFPEK